MPTIPLKCRLVKNIFPLLLLVVQVSLLAQSAPCSFSKTISAVIQEGDIEELNQTHFELAKCGQWPDSLALVFHRLGTAYYGKEQLDSAIIFTHAAQKQWELVNLDTYTLAQGKSNFNLGYFLKQRGSYLQAKPYLRKAVEVYEDLELKGRLQVSYRQLGQVWQNEGAFTEAAAYFRLARDVAEEENDQSSLAKTYLDLGQLLWEKGEGLQALDTLQRALEIFRTQEEEEDFFACQNQIALVYDQLGNKKEAIRYYQQALAGYEDWGNCVRAALVANNLGVAYLEIKLFQEAEEVLNRGLELAEICESLEIIAQSHDNTGELYLSMDQPEAALAAYLKAVETILPPRQGSTIYQLIQYSPHKLDLLTYFTDVALAHKALYQKNKDPDQLRRALLVYQTGDYLIDQIRQGHYDQATQLFWRQKVLPFYEAAIECTYLLEDGDQAFHFFEKSQSVLLLEAVQGAQLLSRISDSLRIVEQHLKNELREAEFALQAVEEGGQKQVEAIFLSAQEQLRAFYEHLAATYPQFGTSKENHHLVDKAQFQAQFLSTTGSGLLHYFWGTRNVYALSVISGATHIVDLGPQEKLAQILTNYLAFFQSNQEIEQAPEAFLSQSYELYTLLIAPLFSDFPSQLIIIPAGPLAYLPFETLIASKANNTQLATADYLLRSSRLLYAYSATLYARPRTERSGTDGALLALAPFAGQGKGDYAQLTYSGEELATIGEYFPAALLRDGAATKRAFLSKQSGNQILHLSTHAFGYSPQQAPHIVFYDSILTLSDIYKLSIPAEMVVLSACQTQTGQLASGEGVLGLGRAFIYAGTGSVVASLWNLNDRFTSQLMGDFYKELAANQPKAEALRRAKLSFLDNPDIPSFQKSPYYWAGLTYYGDQHPLISSGKGLWKYTWLALVGLVLLGSFYTWNRTRS
ncbi:MAG: CHAT domain-containing protein [Lewinella sp.]|uniref:CHAT domain-containing protein n=1 Tax=Lewinella sp. TaxID=2004506 RepID=UPI003D6BA620